MIYVYGRMKRFFVQLRYMSFAKFIHKDVGHKFCSSTITIWLRKSTLLSGLVKVRCIWQSYYSKSHNQIYGIKVIFKMADHSLAVGSHLFKACKTVKICKQIQLYFLNSILNKVEYNAIQFTMMFMIKNFLPTDYASLGNIFFLKLSTDIYSRIFLVHNVGHHQFSDRLSCYAHE